MKIIQEAPGGFMEKKTNQNWRPGSTKDAPNVRADREAQTKLRRRYKHRIRELIAIKMKSIKPIYPPYMMELVEGWQRQE